MKQRLEIVFALLDSPDLVILDEPNAYRGKCRYFWNIRVWRVFGGLFQTACRGGKLK